MAKNEIFSYCLFCFWNGNCWFCWHRFINGLSVLYTVVIFFLISKRLVALEVNDLPSPLSSELGKWFARICEGATFAWRLTTTRASRTWNLFLLDERKSNRGVRMCHRSSQLRVKLIFNKRKGYFTNHFLLKRIQANFNLQFYVCGFKVCFATWIRDQWHLEM